MYFRKCHMVKMKQSLASQNALIRYNCRQSKQGVLEVRRRNKMQILEVTLIL